MTELASTAYPVVMGLARPPSSSRFWAIPIIGILVKGIILIPHFIVLYVLYLVVGIANLVIWIFVLATGRYPDWAFTLVAGYLRWTTRVYLYLLGISDAYPAFSFEAPGDMIIAAPPQSNRFFAIPIIGAIARLCLLIPHLIVLYALTIAVEFCQLVIWIWVLFGGQYPAWAYTLVGGTVLWSTRVIAYLFGLTDQYPPFSFA